MKSLFNMHAQLSSGAIDLRLYLCSYFMNTSSSGSGEAALKRRLI